MKSVLSLSDLEPAVLQSLLRRADVLSGDPRAATLDGKVVALVFLDPSLRTLTSMQTSVVQLGGHPVVLQPGQGSWGLEWKEGERMVGAAAEHLKEAIPVLGGYADIVAVRSFGSDLGFEEKLADALMEKVRSWSCRPLLNLESATSHPCQSLADWKTLDDLGVPMQGGRFVLSWAWHPRALPFAVPTSTIDMAARRGMDVTVLAPRGFELPDSIVERTRQTAREHGGSLVESSDRATALDGAHVIYAKSWGAVDAQLDAEQRGLHEDWCVDESWFAAADEHARFMHCLPIRRNVVAADEILDGPRSAVIQQAHNRLPAQKALLEYLAS